MSPNSEVGEDVMMESTMEEIFTKKAKIDIVKKKRDRIANSKSKATLKEKAKNNVIE